MRLSVIMPVYNVEKFIATCIESLLDQGLNNQEYEIIIVNDGSTDGSLEIAQGYAELNNHIKIIDKKNGGVGSARNCGVDCAKGKYLYFIDSDDYLVSKCLNQLVDTCDDYNLDILTFSSKSFSSLTSQNVLVSRSLNLNASSETVLKSKIVAGEDYVAITDYKGEVWTYLINHEFLKNSEIRFIEGRWLEDVIFTLKIFLEAKRMTHLNLNAHRHRIVPETAMKSKKPEHYNKIIRDLQYAVFGMDSIIKTLAEKKTRPDCVARVRDRQKSLMLFSMIRMLKSTMIFDEVKSSMAEMTKTEAYPLDNFSRKNKSITYQILFRLFRTKRRFYFFFRLANPVLKLRYKFFNPV